MDWILSYTFKYTEPFNFILILTIIFISFKDRANKLWAINFIAILIFSIIQLIKNVLYVDMWILLCTDFILLYNNLKLIQQKETVNKQYYQAPNKIILNNEIDEFEKDIFERDFKKILTLDEFKFLFDMGEKRISKKSMHLALEGQIFDKIYYFAKIPEMKSALIKVKNTHISYLQKGAWIGVIEFIFFLSNRNANKWLIDLDLQYDKNQVVFYEWDATSFLLFFENSYNFSLINKILLIWLKYISNCVIGLDQHISTAMKALIHGDRRARSTSLPICKIII